MEMDEGRTMSEILLEVRTSLVRVLHNSTTTECRPASSFAGVHVKDPEVGCTAMPGNES